MDLWAKSKVGHNLRICIPPCVGKMTKSIVRLLIQAMMDGLSPRKQTKRTPAARIVQTCLAISLSAAVAMKTSRHSSAVDDPIPLFSLPGLVILGRDQKQLVPRNGKTLVVGIVARISGCADQKEVSLEDQIDHAKEVVADLYDRPVHWHIIATKGKGERLDRPELEEIQQRLRSGELDLLVMEDMGRLVRVVEAIRLFGVGVDHGTRCISPNDSVDTIEQTWEEDAMAVKIHESGRRVAVINPDGPKFIACPHLAHVDLAELDSVNALLKRANARLGRQKINGFDPLFRVSRKDTRFPAPNAACWYCGHHHVGGGNGITGNLMCSA